jgi:hypothetical protein
MSLPPDVAAAHVNVALEARAAVTVFGDALAQLALRHCGVGAAAGAHDDRFAAQ